MTVLFTLGFGGALSSAAAIAISQVERTQQQQQFSQRIDSLSSSLQANIARYSSVLQSLSALYSADDTISETAFQAYVSRQLFLEDYSGIQALKWAPVISAAERAQFEASARIKIVEADADGELVAAASRDEYIPITYTALWQGEDKLIPHGLDLGTDDCGREVLDEARNSRTVAASGRIPLVHPPKDQFGFLMSLPVFPTAPVEQRVNEQRVNEQRAHDQSISAQERRELNTFQPTETDTPAGYVVGIFRIFDVVEEALHTLDYNVDFSIRDRTALPNSQFLGNYSAEQHRMTFQLPQASVRGTSYLCPQPDRCTRNLTVGRREWEIVFTPSQSYLLSPISRSAVSVLVLGLSMTACVLTNLLRSQKAIDRLKNINGFKQRYFSMASQELQPQLATMRMCLRALKDNRDRLSNTQQDTLLYRMQTTTQELSQLADDILMFVRVESGMLQFSPHLFDLHAFCEELVSELQVGLKRPGILYENLNRVRLAYLDPLLLRPLLVHLLSNAAKYSPEDSIVHLTLDTAGEQLLIRVSDSGIGIPSSTLQKLFKSFVRGENVGKIPGTGLGLQIAKTCVELHGGTITIDSELNVGTMATVKLPLVN